MASRFLCAALMLLALTGVNYAKPPDLPQDVIDDCEEQAPIHRAGNVIIIGNYDVPQAVILEQVPIYPGQELTNADLRQAVANLKKLNIFENDPEGTGIVPRVEILDPEGPVAFKDVLITVQEKCCAALEDDGKPKCSCETDCKCCGCKKCKEGEAADPKCQCAAGECKCCGCKTAAAVQIESKVKYGCASACTASSCQVVQAGCCQQTGACTQRVSPCSFEVVVVETADGEKKCKCEKDCACCSCKECKDGEKKKGCECKDGECKCCGCKDKTVSTGCKSSGCCSMTFTADACCTGCGACSVTWNVLSEMFPPMKLVTACPKMAVKMHKLMKPAFAMFVKKADAGCCEECGEGCDEECECCAAKKVCEVKKTCTAKKDCSACKKDCATGCCDKDCCSEECECCEAKKSCAAGKCSAKKGCVKKDCSKECCGDECECCEAKQKVCEVKKGCAAACTGAKETAVKKGCAAGCCAKKETAVKKGGCPAGCGAAKAVKIWHVQVCPGAAHVWKHGKKWEVIAATPNECEAVGVMPKETSGCPYVKESQKEQVTLEFKELGTPLENLAKLQKARKLSIKAENAWNKGDYDSAIRCYEKIVELVPGSHHDADAQAALQLAKAMKSVEEMLIDLAKQADEKAGVEEAEPLPCKTEEKDAKDMEEFTKKFTSMLDEAQKLAASGEHAKAQEIALQAATLPRPGTSRVSELMDAAQRSYAAGCHDDALGFAQQALMIDPNCCDAAKIQRCILIQRGQEEGTCNVYGCEGFPYAPGCDEEPCEPCEEGCPGMGWYHALPPVDPAVVRAMEKVMADLNVVVETCDDSDIRLLIDCEEEELELYKDGCRDFPAEALQFKAQLKQMFDMLRQHVCFEVDMGSFQGVRLQVTMQTASGEYGVRIDEGQPVCCWHMIATPPADVKAVQQAHYEEVQRWIEAMNSGVQWKSQDDGEEAEEPLFQLETDLDPCW